MLTQGLLLRGENMMLTTEKVPRLYAWLFNEIFCDTYDIVNAGKQLIVCIDALEKDEELEENLESLEISWLDKKHLIEEKFKDVISGRLMAFLEFVIFNNRISEIPLIYDFLINEKGIHPTH